MNISVLRAISSPWFGIVWEFTRWVLLLLLLSVLFFVVPITLFFALATFSLVEASPACLHFGWWSFVDCYFDNQTYVALGELLFLPASFLLVYWVTHGAGLPLREVFALSVPGYRAAVFWTSIALAWAAMELVVYHWTTEYHIGWEQPEDLTALLSALPMMFLAPVYEELIFRGFLLALLLRRCSSLWVPILVNSALFTVVHGFDRSAFFLISTFLFSILLCWARLRTGSLWVPIIMHALINSLLVAYLVE